MLLTFSSGIYSLFYYISNIAIVIIYFGMCCIYSFGFIFILTFFFNPLLSSRAFLLVWTLLYRLHWLP